MSTFPCVSIMVEDPAQALAEAALAAAAGARLVEWRIDLIAEQPEHLEWIERVIADSPCPSIVTCRPNWEGGEYDGDDQTRISLFEHLGLHVRPRYLDLEFAAWERSANLRQKVKLAIAHPDQQREMDTRLILSMHDFDGRPRDLWQRIERMANEPACQVIKIAWMAKSLRDNLEAFEIMRRRDKPTIALCMGEYGLMSRVLAPKFGGFLTFVSTRPETVTAPGQPTMDELRDLYRVDKIGRETKVYGVIGYPVEHSKSPLIHNAGFDEAGYDGVYLPLPIPPEYEHFKATLAAFLDDKDLDFRGASVTIPHKEHLLRFVKEWGGTIDESAEAVGAANTLVVHDDGSIEACNTDADAVVDSACAMLEMKRDDLAGVAVAIIGAGGMARAAVEGFSRFGASVSIANRTTAKAEMLAQEFNGQATRGGVTREVTTVEPASILAQPFRIVVNATSVGMAGGPDPEGYPVVIPEGAVAGGADGSLLLDTVYTPARTPMIQWAESQGWRTQTGNDLFVRQASAQFMKWTGQSLGPKALSCLQPPE